jgi:hypothetical protein
MVCPSCQAVGAVVGGKCLKCGVPVGPMCPKCSADLAPGEKFCSGCGAEVKTSAERSRERRDQEQISGQIATARRWLLIVSILTFVSGVGFYFIQSNETEKQIAEAERSMAGLEPAERDQALKQQIGMTWDEAVRRDRGAVRLLLFVNLALGAIYLGLWAWAKKNAFVASAIALSLFVTVIVVSAVLEPKSLMQGLLVKIFFTLALAKAISAAARARKLYGGTA